MVEVGKIKIGDGNPFVLIAGPCIVENRELNFFTAQKIYEITSKLNIPFIFKSSYRKANRTSGKSFQGIGDLESLEIIQMIGKSLDVPTLTDIHANEEAELAAKYVDIIQIPAFLCRQTDLLVAAGKTGKIVNIKKGQFLSPYDIKYAVEKVESTGNRNILLTERGTTFGYNNLVVDMRSLVIMRESGYPIVMDATHSVQLPGNAGTTGGDKKFIEPLAKAAVAIGIDALFLEVHPNPKEAMSDKESQLPLDELKNLLTRLVKLDSITKGY